MNELDYKRSLEYKILGCCIIENTLFDKLNLEEKYFGVKELFHYIIKMYERFGNIDITTLAKNYENKSCKDPYQYFADIASYEIETTNITHVNGYYNELKEIYIENETQKLLNKFKNKEITYKEYSNQIQDLIQSNILENSILKTQDIDINPVPEREYTNIKTLDYLLKGIEYGKVSLWSGTTNSGKTTLMTQLARECLKAHKKIFYFSGEQTSGEFKNYLYLSMCSSEQIEKIPDDHNPTIYDLTPKKQVVEYFDNIYSDSLYLYNNDTADNSIYKMLRTMAGVLKRGVRIFFIDNFMQIDDSERLEEQTKIMELFKRFARDNNVIVHLVAHPRKTQFAKHRLTDFDISGTQNIANKSSNICTIMRLDTLSEAEFEEVGKFLFRSGYDIEKCDGVVEVIKTKGNSCKMVGLIYNKDFKRYEECPKIAKEELERLKGKYESKGKAARD